MILSGEIVDYVAKDAQYEGRAYKVKTLTILDRGPLPRLVNTVDFILTEEQASKLPSHDSEQLQGLTVEVGVKEINAGSNGRSRLRGQLLKVNGQAMA